MRIVRFKGAIARLSRWLSASRRRCATYKELRKDMTRIVRSVLRWQREEATKMPKDKPHFEQVPLSSLKELLEAADLETIEKRKLAPSNVVVERPATKKEPYSVRKSS